MVVPIHLPRGFDVERLGVGVERYHVVAVAYLVVGPPSIRGENFRVLRQTAIVPRQRITNLETRVFHARKQPVMGSVATEGE